MEGAEKKASSASLASDLFGSNSKEHSSTATGYFDSIFSDSSKGLRQEARSETIGNKQDSPGEDWSRRFETPGNHHAPSTDSGSYFVEHKVQPCHLSSSIYYGGQDVYSPPSDGQNHGSQPPVKKDGGEEDDGAVSRGNWWKGSLYY